MCVCLNVCVRMLLTCLCVYACASYDTQRALCDRYALCCSLYACMCMHVYVCISIHAHTRAVRMWKYLHICMSACLYILTSWLCVSCAWLYFLRRVTLSMTVCCWCIIHMICAYMSLMYVWIHAHMHACHWIIQACMYAWMYAHMKAYYQ